MARRPKYNELGLRLIDYDMAFSGWKVPRILVVHFHGNDVPIDEAKAQMLRWAQSNGAIRAPARTRRLSLSLVKNKLESTVIKEARKLAARRMTKEARDWLCSKVPAVRDMPRVEEAALQGAVDVVGSDVPHGGKLMGDEPLPVHVEESYDDLYRVDASEFTKRPWKP